MISTPTLPLKELSSLTRSQAKIVNMVFFPATMAMCVLVALVFPVDIVVVGEVVMVVRMVPIFSIRLA